MDSDIPSAKSIILPKEFYEITNASPSNIGVWVLKTDNLSEMKNSTYYDKFSDNSLR